MGGTSGDDQGRCPRHGHGAGLRGQERREHRKLSGAGRFQARLDHLADRRRGQARQGHHPGLDRHAESRPAIHSSMGILWLLRRASAEGLRGIRSALSSADAGGKGAVAGRGPLRLPRPADHAQADPQRRQATSFSPPIPPGSTTPISSAPSGCATRRTPTTSRTRTRSSRRCRGSTIFWTGKPAIRSPGRWKGRECCGCRPPPGPRR